jgi:hypothetical protein
MMGNAERPNPQMQLTGACVSMEVGFVHPCGARYVHHYRFGGQVAGS